MISVQRGDLGALRPIDTDAFTRRFAVEDPVPGLPYPLRYRELLPDESLPAGVTPEETRSRLVQAVALRDRCSDADRASLDVLTDWSLALVEEHGLVVGVLQPDLPEDLLHPAPGNSSDACGAESAGNSSDACGAESARNAGRRRALTLRDLCASDEAARANGIDRSAIDSDVVRLTLAALLGYTIHLLHRNRIVYSDLTLGSVAIGGSPPRTVLIGCDPMAALRDTGHRPSLHGDTATLDTSRLALCVIRALAKGPGATQLTDPGRVGALLGQPGVELIARALRPAATTPPTAEEISEYLISRRAELARQAGVLADSASGAQVHGLSRFDTQAHARLRPPDIAGQLRGLLPRLSVPDLPVLTAPPVAASWPRRPIVSTDEHPPPRLQSPAIDLDLAGMSPAGLVSGLTDLSGTLARAYSDANRQIGDALRGGLRTLQDALGVHLRARDDGGQPSDGIAEGAARLAPHR